MASPTQWTWVWVNSESFWWTGRPGMLQSMGSQRVRHNWVTELNWTELIFSSQVQIRELDHKEGWVLKNWCFRIVVLEKTLESPLDCNEIKAVDPKGTQPWIFIGRTNAEAEAPILWPPEVKSRLIGKRPWCWKKLRARGEGETEDKVVGWHHQHSGHGFEQILGGSEGQGSLACCNSWGHKESDTT